MKIKRESPLFLNFSNTVRQVYRLEQFFMHTLNWKMAESLSPYQILVDEKDSFPF
jgi:hypothetical protein